MKERLGRKGGEKVTERGDIDQEYNAHDDNEEYADDRRGGCCGNSYDKRKRREEQRKGV